MISMFDSLIEKILCYFVIQVASSLDHEYPSLHMHPSYDNLVEGRVLGIF